MKPLYVVCVFVSVVLLTIPSASADTTLIWVYNEDWNLGSKTAFDDVHALETQKENQGTLSTLQVPSVFGDRFLNVSNDAITFKWRSPLGSACASDNGAEYVKVGGNVPFGLDAVNAGGGAMIFHHNNTGSQMRSTRSTPSYTFGPGNFQVQAELDFGGFSSLPSGSLKFQFLAVSVASGNPTFSNHITQATVCGTESTTFQILGGGFNFFGTDVNGANIVDAFIYTWNGTVRSSVTCRREHFFLDENPPRSYEISRFGSTWGFSIEGAPFAQCLNGYMGNGFTTFNMLTSSTPGAVVSIRDTSSDWLHRNAQLNQYPKWTFLNMSTPSAKWTSQIFGHNSFAKTVIWDIYFVGVGAQWCVDPIQITDSTGNNVLLTVGPGLCTQPAEFNGPQGFQFRHDFPTFTVVGPYRIRITFYAVSSEYLIAVQRLTVILQDAPTPIPTVKFDLGMDILLNTFLPCGIFFVIVLIPTFLFIRWGRRQKEEAVRTGYGK